MLLPKTKQMMILRYWQLIRLDPAGGVKIEEIQEAKAFFQQEFPDPSALHEQSETRLHRHLFALYRYDRLRGAQLCLRCFISYQIEKFCRQLAAYYHLDCHLILPFVLDDTIDQKIDRSSVYQPLAHKILETFDPERSALATWTSRLVKRHSELNEFLLQEGIYLISDWAILNDAKIPQVQRIFLNFYRLTAREIQEDCQLLESYHAVYRAQRIQKRQEEASRSKCPKPTDHQLEQIRQYLQQNYHHCLSSKQVLKGLERMAKQLRDYRIYTKGSLVKTKPIDDPQLQDHIEFELLDSRGAEEDNLQELQFSSLYHQDLVACIDGAIEHVLEIRFQKKTRMKQTPRELAAAFHALYCQGKSQEEIALELNLSGQPQVARLLKLDSFRTDIRQQILITLIEKVLEKAKVYIHPDRLLVVESQIQSALAEQVNTLILTSSKSEKTIFSSRLCAYIRQRFPSNFT